MPDFILVTAATVLLGILTTKLYAWMPALARVIVGWAAGRMLDPEMRSRVGEEWSAVLDEIPGGISQLAHALSLLIRARNIEREWLANMSADDVADRLSSFKDAVTDFGVRFREAREGRGISIQQIARVTRISTATLRALEGGELRKVPHGYFGSKWLTDLKSMFGTETFELLKKDYQNLFYRAGGFPPRRQPSASQNSHGFWCRLFGHDGKYRHLHVEYQGHFHWCYIECERCGDTSIMWSERCTGEKARRQQHPGGPLVDVFTCEDDQWWWPSYSLEAPPWVRLMQTTHDESSMIDT